MLTEKEWDDRVRKFGGNLRDMVWQTGDFVQQDELVRSLLASFRGKKVLDVGCGYGRFADVFDPEDYVGVDSSKEMIDLAKKLHPEYEFHQGTVAKSDPLNREYDVIFEVISLGPLGMTEEEFLAMFKPHCKVVAMFQEHYRIVTNFRKDSSEDRDAWDKNHAA